MLHGNMLDYLCCPQCQGLLAFEGKGTLICKSCSASFDVINDSVYCFVNEQSLSSDEKTQATYYDETANRPLLIYHIQRRHRERQLKVALDLLGIDSKLIKSKSCLCVGGGEGWPVLPILKTGAFCVSMDISLGALKAGATFLRMVNNDLESHMKWLWTSAIRPFPFRNNVFDINMAAVCINHLPPGTWGNYLSERFRVTKKGGVVFDIVANIGNPFWSKTLGLDVEEYARFCTLDNLKGLYEKFDFQEINCRLYDRTPESLVWCSLPEAALKSFFGIKSRAYPNYCFNLIYPALAKLDDLVRLHLPGLLLKTEKYLLIFGVK